MKYCSLCGSQVRIGIPPGDNRPRHICDHCNTVHYHNPKVVAGCIARWEDKVLMCRRAIEPRYGYWTVPAGFMENEETLQEAAARETQEEAEATVEVGDLFAIIDVVRARQVHMMFRTRMIGAAYDAGAENLETVLIDPDDIPWDDIAFPSVRFALEMWLEDQRRGRVGLHMTAFRAPRIQD